MDFNDFDDKKEDDSENDNLNNIQTNGDASDFVKKR